MTSPDYAVPDWAAELPSAITVCDDTGTILYMNTRSVQSFEEDGGIALIGTNVLECHPEPAKSKLEAMLRSGEPNIYTIEKKGKKKLIYQSPWYREGTYAGFVEISIELPDQMPHFVRTP
jgi:transcriptional regulator with PAS, ATPase and Fis domain